ncbi:amino acid permease [Brochothrix thermosphacta]|uniref:Amino acid permease n=1 Tax=Brochothrix thermosphacta TaxID=2756 RepID=A0A1D2KMQ0_BROTH|nr:amino acid permease [Brochothrix thermosphacta]ATF26592.1 amino acid permease [Brochothrix thermosphacta]ATH85947.1 amino acid permease [Brochothrix thermosphacta]EUJ37405.1 Lysine-specific permease [Brochothrix thermosphacta DSM 20171 = FSL F6-1036]MPQ29419.1 amino acid permease [Brochothrix thermosphacta]ODJ48402.1 gamma-aminobutyrate permease [Brochothrix thermosphacta DSM 20171 = FSL F6-1036]
MALDEHHTVKTQGVKRQLKTRHLSMIAIGGSIGTGLFVASGSAISTAGPGGALVAYVGIGLMVFFLMTSLGEMATYLPVSGSFSTYATRFVDPAFGFAMGWNYWFNWAITLAVDVSTAALIMRFWVPQIPGWIFSVFFLLIIFALNALTVKAFGEAEYWFSIIKVITVIAFIIIGILTIFGILGGHYYGLSNFTYKEAPFVGGVPAILAMFVIAGFSFQGTELIGITAGESKTPEKSIPKAIKTIFWRILLFYILAIAIIAAIIPYTSPDLLGGSETNVAMSPFTLIFKNAGLAMAAGVMNAIILTSVLSAGNSGMYASTRMLMAMGQSGQAPRRMGRVNKRGIPMNALIFTGIVAGLALLTSILGPQVYLYLVAASGLTGFIAWIGIAVSHYRFRRAYKLQGHSLDELKYKAKWFPLGPILALVLCILVIVGQDLASFAKWDIQAILVTYMSIPLFLFCYFFYKIKHKTKLIPLEKVDLEKTVVVTDEK